ncbi:MAG: DUF4373 domain-containing protein [Acholeplasmataceae bacterium]|nr:DUF4373 domain-containing protein [Acholeplasmataceae bacterium]
MARPFKLGLQYFPLDINFFEDEKITDLNLMYGVMGEMVYIRLLTMIYAHGYYLEMTTEQAAKALIKSIGNAWAPSVNDIERIILRAGANGLFDKELLQMGVFTSKAIQRQFTLSTRRRRGIAHQKYWLLDQHTMLELSNFYKKTPQVNVDNNPSSTEVIDSNNDTSSGVMVSNNGSSTEVIAYKSTQKEKEKKKERDKKDKLDKGVYALPRYHYITKAIIKSKYIEDGTLEIGKYNKLFDEAVSLHGFDDVIAATDYIVSYSKRADPPIDDKFSFMRKSLMNNLEMFQRRRDRTDESIEDWLKRIVL